jgi:hypothetical protein
MRRLAWLAGGLAIGAIVAGGAIVTLGPGRTDASQAPTTPAVRLATAEVVRRTLESTEELDGALGYEGEGTIVNGLAGTVTWLPEEGMVARQGDPILEVDGRDRAVVLYGKRPAWRPMREGMSNGADVAQLETALKSLGYLRKSHHPNREFDDTTADALREWQEDLGVREDGVVDLGEVVFTDGPVRLADVRLMLGVRAGPGATLATTTSANRVVTLDLDAERQDILAAGDAVGIKLPDGSSTTGTVWEIGTVADASSGESTVPVTIALDDPGATGTLDGAPVTVHVTRTRREDVLAVPVESLLALSEGGYAVQVVDASGSSRLVGVELGLFADGYVQVTGGVAEGDQVAVPR